MKVFVYLLNQKLATFHSLVSSKKIYLHILLLWTYSFFKGAPSQSSCFLSVDSVTGNSHQVTLRSHDITKQRQVAIVDIRTIKRDDMVHLPFNAFSHSLNTKCLRKTELQNQIHTHPSHCLITSDNEDCQNCRTF